LRTSKLPKYVYRQKIKGHVYYRFRRAGGGSVRLPGDPGTAAFHARYAELLENRPSKGRYEPGSVAHTIELYLNSAEYSQLAAATQRDYKRYLHRLDRSVGDRPMESVEASYIFQLRDKLKSTPVAANHAVAVIRALFAFAMTRGTVSSDPTKGITKLAGGSGYLRWTDDEIARFRACAEPMMRLALEMGLYTGQRLSDVIRLTWSNYDGTRIRLRQQKTGTSLSIPVHPELKTILDNAVRLGIMILTTKTGRAFHPRVFSRDFLVARREAGLPDGLSFHGLRHTAAARLAELGAGAPEIQAITGHKSLKLVEHYIRQASQEVQADRAIARLPAPKSAKQVLN
jgi:integrase